MKRERDDMCVGEGGGQGEARGIYACASGHRGVKRRNCVLVQAQREREVVKRKTDGESMAERGEHGSSRKVFKARQCYIRA